MTRALLMVILLLPATALAQDPIPSSSPSPDLSQHGLRITWPPLVDLNLALVTEPRAARQATAQAPAPERRRRRPSMVGYMEDSSIQSQLRFRFDTAFGNDVPDRAEFFYAKCGCYQLDPPPFFDPEAPGPGPGVPIELDYQQFYAFGEYAFGDRFSTFAELPFRALQPQGFLDFGEAYAPWPDHSGFADIKFGAKAALYTDEDRDVIVQLRASAPSGDASMGTSTDSWSIEPTLLLHSNLADRVGLEAQLGLWHPLGGSNGVEGRENFSGDVLFYGIGPSFDLLSADETRLSAVVELVGWRVLSGNQTGCGLDGSCVFDAKGVNIANLKLGARATMAGRNSIYAGYGWALTDEHWYDKVFRVEYRLMFR
jgi:hypothetical protein